MVTSMTNSKKLTSSGFLFLSYHQFLLGLTLRKETLWAGATCRPLAMRT